MAIAVDPDFGYVLLSGCLLGLIYICHGPLAVGKVRFSTFTK